MTGRLSALRWSLLVLQRSMQLRQEHPRSLGLIGQQGSIPSQDVANQCVEISVLAQSHAKYVVNFTSQAHGPSLADPLYIRVQQRLPGGASIDTADQPRKTFGHLRKGLAKSKSDDFDTRLEIEGQRIGAWRSCRLLHKYLTSILQVPVNPSKNNVVDNMQCQRDIKSVNAEIWL